MPNIPPFVDDWKIVTMKVFPEDTVVFSLSPHAHLRGKRFTYTLVGPAGNQQTRTFRIEVEILNSEHRPILPAMSGRTPVVRRRPRGLPP